MFAAAGAQVVVADVDMESAQAVAEEIGGTALRCDVGVLADNHAAVSLAEKTYGGLDVLMLNAGVNSGFTLDDFDEAGYRRAMGVNLDGVVFGLVAGVPALRLRGGGRIVAVASLAGLAPVPEDPVYAANKAAVVNLVRSVAPDLHADGISVNALCPGYTDTAILGRFRAGLEAVNWPLMAVEDVVAAVSSILASTRLAKPGWCRADTNLSPTVSAECLDPKCRAWHPARPGSVRAQSRIRRRSRSLVAEHARR